MAEMAGWEESEQYSSKETLSIASTLLLGIRAQERQGCPVKGLEFWGYLWSFYFCDARKSEPTYPARCHINVVPLMYVNETSDLLSGGKICMKVVVHAESTYNHQHCLSGPMRAVLLAC